MKRLKHKDREYVELSSPLNCIPAGIYKVVNREDDAIHLSVSSKIVIGILGHYQPYVTPVTHKEGIKRRKRQTDFLNEYDFLMKEMKNMLPDLSKPFTYCGVDASLTEMLSCPTTWNNDILN